MFKELDPLLHSQLRLAVISILLSVEEAEFVYLREKDTGDSGKPECTDRQTERSRLHRSRKELCRKETPYHLPDNIRRTTGIRELRLNALKDYIGGN